MRSPAEFAGSALLPKITKAGHEVKRLVAGAAVAGIAVFGGAGAFDDDTTRDASGEIVEAGGLGVYAIQTGDCLQFPEETEIASLEAVPCSTPHDGQAFAKTQSGYIGEYDDESTVFHDAIFESCVGSFEGFVGTSYEESTLYVDYLYPGPEDWAAGKRDITCLLVPEGTVPLTGDMQGSGL